MSTYQHNCNSDFRNEGWTFSGTGVDQCWKAWSAIGDDTKYCKNPATKGRGCVRFPVDISSGNIPDGAVITSITLYLRCNKTDSVDRTVTINLMCSDDTSRFTSRTIHPTTTITTIEVGTFTTDCLGNQWTKDRLNRIMCQVFSYCGTADKIRCYEFYAVVNYHIRPTVLVTAPSGTNVTPSPTISWTYSQPDGDTQLKAEYKVFTSIQQEVFNFNPDHSTAVYSGTVTGDTTSLVLPTALAPDSYYLYVRVKSSLGAWSLWADRTFTIVGSAPGTPGGSFGGIGVGGGGGFVSVIADRVTSTAYLQLQDGSNLLGVHAADFETTTDGTGYTATNCTMAQDTSKFYGNGGASLKITASSAATMSILSAMHEIAPSAAVTARAQFITAVTTRTVNVYILFYDATFTSVGGTLTGTGTDPSTTWTEVSCTGTSPATAVYAQVKLEVVSPANAEVHRVDHVGLMYGTDSVWSNGGHASRNLLSASAANAEDPAASEPWVATGVASTYSRVASTGATGFDGLKQFKMLYAGTTPSLSFVSTGTAFTDTSTGTGYTLNRPASLLSGDLLVAYVASDSGVAANVPDATWTVQDTTSTTGCALTVMTRDVVGGEPATWTGNWTSSATRKRAVVVAYRGAASSAAQFLVNQIASSISGSPNAPTATVNNTDANAWRLSAFAFDDDVTGGANTANITAPSIVPIQFVAASAVWKDITAATTYTINKPPGVQTGDLMIACISGAFNGSSVSTPSGWTLVTSHTSVNGPHSQYIYKRTAGASESSSWTGTVTGGTIGKTKVTQVVAYRNCDTAANQFIDSNGNVNTTGGSSITTPVVANTNSNAWSVAFFSADGDQSDSWSGGETIERGDNCAAYSTWNDKSSSTLQVSDSNGTISTGNRSKTASFSESGGFFAACSWIGILKPITAAGTPGAGETERQDVTAGASNPWITLAVYDSNTTAATGLQAVYPTFSGSSPVSSCQWIGMLAPAAPTVSGEVSVISSSYIDISSISQDVIDRAGGFITVAANFLGSSAGTPYFKLYSYTGNELIATQVDQGSTFNTTTWVKSSVTFPITAGTTRFKLTLAGEDRIVNDIVYFDRVSLALGSSSVYRNGTGQIAHPIFNRPVIEYAQDTGEGYGDWAVLPGTEAALLTYDNYTGLVSLLDQTIVPLSGRKYRAKTISYGLAGDTFVSNYGPESDEVTLVADEWWLKDIEDSSNSLQLKVRQDPLAVNKLDTSAIFQPLGASRPVVLTEGYKGDTIDITVEVDRVDYVALLALLDSRKTLYLQSNSDAAWWVRPVGDIQAETQLTSAFWTDPLRFEKLTFVEVDSI